MSYGDTKTSASVSETQTCSLQASFEVPGLECLRVTWDPFNRNRQKRTGENLCSTYNPLLHHLAKTQKQKQNRTPGRVRVTEKQVPEPVGQVRSVSAASEVHRWPAVSSHFRANLSWSSCWSFFVVVLETHTAYGQKSTRRGKKKTYAVTLSTG